MIDFPSSEKSKRPTTEQVDYFSFDFDLLDLHSCWKKSKETGKSKSWKTQMLGKRRGF